MPDLLHRYFDTVGAHATLESGSLLYRSPVDFNDPFDCQVGFFEQLSWRDVRHEMIRVVVEAVYSTKIPDFTLEMIGDSVRNLRAVRSDTSRTKIQEFLKAGFPDLEPIFREYGPVYEKEVRDAIASLRVACLTETRESILMWAHYAKCHGGVVLSFEASPRLVPANAQLLPVRYQDEMPLVQTPDIFARTMLIKDEPEDLRNDIFRVLATKASYWDYEREWRIILPRVELAYRRDGGIAIVPFHRECLKCVTFGVKTAAEERERIAQLVGRQWPGVRIEQAVVRSDKFGMSFREC